MKKVIVIVALLVALAGTLALTYVPSEPQDHSPFRTVSGTSYLMDGDKHLRACDQWRNTLPFVGWSRDKQSGNTAFVSDNSGANDGNCADKWLNRRHDKHGAGAGKVDVKSDIQDNRYSGH